MYICAAGVVGVAAWLVYYHCEVSCIHYHVLNLSITIHHFIPHPSYESEDPFPPTALRVDLAITTSGPQPPPKLQSKTSLRSFSNRPVKATTHPFLVVCPPRIGPSAGILTLKNAGTLPRSSVCVRVIGHGHWALTLAYMVDGHGELRRVAFCGGCSFAGRSRLVDWTRGIGARWSEFAGEYCCLMDRGFVSGLGGNVVSGVDRSVPSSRMM